jgi:hypothetical protein
MSPAGLTPAQVITLATAGCSPGSWAKTTGARCPWASAPISCLLDADPLLDIRNTARIDRVMSRGVWYEPSQLMKDGRHAGRLAGRRGRGRAEGREAADARRVERACPSATSTSPPTRAACARFGRLIA